MKKKPIFMKICPKIHEKSAPVNFLPITILIGILLPLSCLSIILLEPCGQNKVYFDCFG